MHENSLEPRVRHLEGIITGDGEKMGVGPLVLKHEKEINGRDGLAARVRKLEDQALKIAIYTGIAVTIAMTLAPMLLKLISKNL